MAAATIGVLYVLGQCFRGFSTMVPDPVRHHRIATARPYRNDSSIFRRKTFTGEGKGEPAVVRITTAGNRSVAARGFIAELAPAGGYLTRVVSASRSPVTGGPQLAL